MALGGLVATAIALPVLRTRGAYMVVATMAFGLSGALCAHQFGFAERRRST